MNRHGQIEASCITFEQPVDAALFRIKNAVFTDLFFDQNNIIYVHVNGNSTSLMLTKHPNPSLVFLNVPFYIQLGFDHISDLAGYDHILFLVALCAVYRLEHWKNRSVTAFTVGHSITLALTSFGVIVVSSEMIEFLIPLTICVTAALNVVNYELVAAGEKLVRRYLAALFFGFIQYGVF